MKKVLSNKYISHIKYRTKSLSKIIIFTIFNIIILMIKCEEERSLVDNNDLLLFLTKDGYLHAYQKNEKNEKWELFFGNLFPKNINFHKIDEDIFLYTINEKLYIFIHNNLIPFDTFVKELTNTNSINGINASIEGKINNSFFRINLKTGDILENINCDKNKDNIKIKLESNEILLKKVNYIMLNSNNKKNGTKINISYRDISIVGKNNKFSFLEYNNNMNISYNLVNYFKYNISLDKIITIYCYNYDKDILYLLYDKNLLYFNINMNKYDNKNVLNIGEENNKEYHNDTFNKLNNYNTINTYSILFYFIVIIAIIFFIKYIPKIFIINYNNTNIFNENYNYKLSQVSNSNYNENIQKCKNKEICNNINNFSIIDKINKNKDDKKIKFINIDICCNINSFSIISDKNKNEEKKIININNNNIQLNTLTKKYKDLSLKNPFIPRSHSACKLCPCCEDKNKLIYNSIKNCDLEQEDGKDDIDSNIIKKNSICASCDILHNYFTPNNIKSLNQTIDIIGFNQDNLNYYIKIKRNMENLVDYIIPKNEMTREILFQCKLLSLKSNKNQLLPDNNIENKKNEETSEVNNEEPSEKIISKRSTKEDSKNSKKSKKKLEEYGMMMMMMIVKMKKILTRVLVMLLKQKMKKKINLIFI